MNSDEIIIMVICSSLLILVLVAIMAIVFVIAAKQKLRQEIALTQTKIEFEKELRQVENEVSESLMSRFAQELHDNIGQLHTAMYIQIQNQKIDHPEIGEKLNVIETYLGEATRQLKILSRTLNYDYLGHAGLLPAVDMEVEKLRNLKRFDVKYNKEGLTTPLNKNQELMVFRIFQEIIQNALRYSSAKILEVTLTCSENDFYFRIGDDGKGFNVESILSSAASNGLRNMRKRAEMAELKFELTSSPGNGTVYVLKKVHL
jgi:two-component system, NarL family, sensor kinase